MRMMTVLFPVLVGLCLRSPALAQNPCEEIGSDCRVMTAAEVKALKERFLGVRAALPVPDPARYAHDGAAEASTMPFVAETGIPGAVPSYRSWPAGCFTTLVWLRPHPHLVDNENGKCVDVTEPEAVNVERPAKAFAPVRSLELLISGPRAEVAALKKIDRRAFGGAARRGGEVRQSVAGGRHGSRHDRGCATDPRLFALKTAWPSVSAAAL